MRTALSAVLASLVGSGGFAQWGVRATFLQFDRMSSVETMVKLQLGVGIDIDTGPRTGLGLDVFFDPGLSAMVWEPRDVFLVRSTGARIAYSRTVVTYGCRLRSLYFFTDNDAAAPYVGVTAGVRSYMLDLSGGLPADGSTLPIGYSTRASMQRTMVPVGLLIGVRDELASSYVDLHFSIGYQIGGGGSMFDGPGIYYVDPPLLGNQRELRMHGFTLGFGCAFGLGISGKGSRTTEE